MGCHQSGWLRFVLAGVLRDFDGRAGHKIEQAGDLAIGTALVEVPLAFAASRPAAVQARGAVCYPSILFREHAKANPPLRDGRLRDLGTILGRGGRASLS